MFVPVWHSLPCHGARMPNERLSKTVFYGELQEGSGHKKRYKDTIKLHLRISLFQLSIKSRLHSIEQSGVVSYEKEQLIVKLRLCES